MHTCYRASSCWRTPASGGAYCLICTRWTQCRAARRSAALAAHSAGASATLGNQLAIAWPTAEMRRCALCILEIIPGR
jgi:hypothetical protein